MGNDLKTSAPRIVTGFDEDLWKAGVEDGAFSGTKGEGARWYVMDTGGIKVAIGSAVPGPGDLTTVSYYVAPAWRNQGYGTKLARYIADQHEKASFVMKKENEASVKVALAALRGKFAATMGRHVVRLTKEATKSPSELSLMSAAEALSRSRGVDKKRVKPGTSFKDELDRIEAVLEAEDFAGVRITPQAEARMKTVSDLARAIERGLGRRKSQPQKTAAPLSGGLAEKEGKKPSDFDPKLVEEGRKVEMEHTDDPAMAKRIATDHLTEDKDYYKKLKKIEKKAADEKESKKPGPTFGPYMHLVDDVGIVARLFKKADLFGHPLGFMAGGIAGEMALGKKYPFAAPVGGAILGGQIAKHMMAPKPQRRQLEKGAVDPVMLGLGAAATALTTALTAKQIKSQVALTEAVQKTQAAKKALIAALAGAGAAGAVGGYALGKKKPKKTEKTTVLQPIVVTPDEVPTKAADDRSESIERARRHLRGLVRPFSPLYKTKSAQGWDVLVESIITDSQASGAGK